MTDTHQQLTKNIDNYLLVKQIHVTNGYCNLKWLKKGTKT